MKPLHRGYTLVELLVVVAVLAILMGLLIPAVQKVRAAAARMSCANNLKQIVLAAHSYHDTDDAFPSAVRRSRTADYPALSWFGRLLPYLDQQPMWERTVADYAKTKDPFAESPAHGNRDKLLPVVSCPSDDRLKTAWVVPLFKPKMPLAMTSYQGNSGTNHRANDGVIYRNSRVRLTNISDGASNTLLVGERPPSPELVFGWWYAGAGMAGTGALDFTLGAQEVNSTYNHRHYRACGRGPFTYGPGKFDDYCAVFHYWSPHDGGANFAFCDGSVRFLAYSAASVLPALATRAGDEVVAVPD